MAICVLARKKKKKSVAWCLEGRAYIIRIDTGQEDRSAFKRGLFVRNKRSHSFIDGRAYQQRDMPFSASGRHADGFLSPRGRNTFSSRNSSDFRGPEDA